MDNLFRQIDQRHNQCSDHIFCSWHSILFRRHMAFQSKDLQKLFHHKNYDIRETHLVMNETFQKIEEYLKNGK